MGRYKFVRTVVHTEIVEVERPSFDEALEAAGEVTHGEHQDDESLVCIEPYLDH